LDGKGLVLHSLEEFRGKGSSKQQKVAELPPSGEASVLDMLVGLLEEVNQLREEVRQQGKLILTGLEVMLGKLKEERIYPEQDLKGSN